MEKIYLNCDNNNEGNPDRNYSN